MVRLAFLAVALLATGPLLLTACAQTDELPDPVESDPPPPEDIVSGIGTVTYVDLEGGFYGIVANDSTRYLPKNLEETYKEDGMRVRFRGVKNESVATIQMWGTMLELLDVMQMDD